MQIVQTKSKAVEVSSDDDGYVYTCSINFAPGYVHGTVALTENYGDGGFLVGISGYKYRPQPDGPEKTVSFGGVSDWKSFIGAQQRTTSVSLVAFCGPDSQLRGRLDLFFWG